MLNSENVHELSNGLSTCKLERDSSIAGCRILASTVFICGRTVKKPILNTVAIGADGIGSIVGGNTGDAGGLPKLRL